MSAPEATTPVWITDAAASLTEMATAKWADEGAEPEVIDAAARELEPAITRELLAQHLAVKITTLLITQGEHND